MQCIALRRIAKNEKARHPESSENPRLTMGKILYYRITLVETVIPGSERIKTNLNPLTMLVFRWWRTFKLTLASAT